MSRTLLLLCSLALGIAALPFALRAEEPKTPEVVAGNGTSSPYLVKLKHPDTGVVIRSAEELVAHSAKPESAKDPAVQKATEAELAKFLKVESIDWSKQMVLAVQSHPTKDRKSTRLNSSHSGESRMPSSA